MRSILRRRTVFLFLLGSLLSLSFLLVFYKDHKVNVLSRIKRQIKVSKTDIGKASTKSPGYPPSHLGSVTVGNGFPIKEHDFRKSDTGTDFNDFNLTALQEYVYHHIRRISKKITGKEIKYYNLSRPRTDHCNFLITGANICDRQTPFVVVLVPSATSNTEKRLAIRQTWGKYAKDLKIALPENSSTVTLAFLLGKAMTLSSNQALRAESKKYQDIVIGDFYDTYKNLTRKMLLGLKWVSKFCSKARYILKADDDSFVHIPRMVKMLKQNPSERSVYGRLFMRSPVQRTGKWAVSKTDYPLHFYPPYLSGVTYVISGNIVRNLLMASQYMPYLHLEDAFITGILRLIIGAYSVHSYGFTWLEDEELDPCKFMMAEETITVNVQNVSFLKTMWSAQQKFPQTCVISKHMTLAKSKGPCNNGLYLQESIMHRGIMIISLLISVVF